MPPKPPPLPPPSRLAAPRADQEPAPRLGPGLVVAGKYRLTQVLRHGGMGSVWVATHLALESPVAIKFMSLAPAPKLGHAETTNDREEIAALRARFEREAKAAAQIRSANVVQILDYGIDRGMPYLVMELLKGEDLGTRLARNKRLDLGETVRILAPLSRALDRAHQSGLVHRDLKPENVFLCDEGGEEIVKILDFGVAKTLHGDRQVGTPTLEGTVVGSPHYMSPEQAMGSTDVDHRSDLWSLAVIAFRALTGARPFEGNLLLETVVKICSGPIPTATSVASDLGADIDAFFKRALSREPNERFQSARELVSALAAIAHASGHDVGAAIAFTGAFPVSTTAIAAAPPSTTPAPRKGRLPLAVAALVVVGAATATVVLGSLGRAPADGPAALPSDVIASAKATVMTEASASASVEPRSPDASSDAVAKSSAQESAQASASSKASAAIGRPAQPPPLQPLKKPKRDVGY